MNVILVLNIFVAVTLLLHEPKSTVVAARNSESTFIFHHHIHKCGGFSFMTCVRNVLNLCKGRESDSWECSAYPKRHINGDYEKIATGQIDFVSAEEPWNNDWTQNVDRSLLASGVARAKISTFFRDASSRVISNYLYNMVQNAHRLPVEKQNVSILEVLRTKQASGSNFMARRSLPSSLYSKLSKSVGASTGIFLEVERSQVREHIRNEFEFVGIVEEFDLSVCLWLHTFVNHQFSQHCNPKTASSGKLICPKVNQLKKEIRESPQVRHITRQCNNFNLNINC